MQTELRNKRASGLRQLFQEQWEYLSRLIDRYQTQQRERARQRLLETRQIESVVDGTNGSMRALSHYKEQLRASVRVLIDYVENLVERLPAPLHVSAGQFAADPQVKGIFARKQAIFEIFGRSDELREFFAAEENSQLQQAYAILFMQRQEKSVLGMELRGETIVRDVRQTRLNFAGHQIKTPCGSEQELRAALKTLLFDSFVAYIKYHLARLGQSQSASSPHQSAPTHDHWTRRHLQDLENPEVYLRELTRLLQNPQQLLRLERNTLCVDPMRIKGPCAKNPRLTQIHLQEILLGRNARQVICMVSFPRDEMPAKKDLLSEAQAVLGPF